MKRFALVLMMAIFAVTAFGQENGSRVPNGYQGFIEEGNTWHFDKNMTTTINLSTTHGFYFNEHIYAGLGVGFEFNSDYFMMPFYTNLRYVFINNKAISPLLSLRLGSYISESMGAYGDLAFGVRFASKRDFAVTVLVAGTYFDKLTYDTYDYGTGNYVYSTVNPSGICLRMGIEW